MTFYEAENSFKEAIKHVDSRTDPKTWNMLIGLISLSQALRRLESEVGSLKSSSDQTSANVRRLKNR